MTWHLNKWFFLVAVPFLMAQANPDSSDTSAFERAAKLSDQQKKDRAEQHLSSMKRVLSTVLGMLKTSREEKDIIKINCINEKLTKIKGLIRISEQADIALQEALAKSEPEAAVHEFHRIDISSQKVRLLRTEAEQCVGELAFVIGKSTVEVEKDPDLVPEEDPSETDFPDTPVERPPAASPYR